MGQRALEGGRGEGAAEEGATNEGRVLTGVGDGGRADRSPGSTVGACTKEESFALVAKAINKVHKDVPEVITVIENMVSAI